MKKLFWICGLLLLLAACGQREEAGNLILTNYAAQAISHVTVECGGETLSSEAAISDTQLCVFTLPEEAEYAYTVSFETADGETAARDFTDDFTGGNTVYLRVDQEDGVWRLEYDEIS